MLTKLLKHEYRATARTFLPIYALLFALACINKLFLSSDMLQNLLNGIPMIILNVSFVGTCIGVVILSMILTIQRFQKNILGDEGYLMNTLATRPWKLILSKFIVSTTWITLSVLLSVFNALFVVLDFQTLISLPRMISFLNRFLADYGMLLDGWLFLLLLLTTLAQMFLTTLQVYAAMTLGQLSDRHRTVLSFAAFFAISIFSQLVIGLGGSVIIKAAPDFLSSFTQTSDATIRSMLGLSIAYNLLFGSALYALTNYLLKHRLNLQ